MLRIKTINTLATAYIVVSIFLGPAIFLVGDELFPKHVACFDADIFTPASELQLYQKSQFVETVASVLMILLGLILLALVLDRRQQLGKDRTFIAAAGIVFMLMGYGFIILLSAYLTSCMR